MNITVVNAVTLIHASSNLNVVSFFVVNNSISVQKGYSMNHYPDDGAGQGIVVM